MINLSLWAQNADLKHKNRIVFNKPELHQIGPVKDKTSQIFKAGAVWNLASNWSCASSLRVLSGDSFTDDFVLLSLIKVLIPGKFTALEKVDNELWEQQWRKEAISMMVVCYEFNVIIM